MLKPWNGIYNGYRYTHPEGLEVSPDGCIYYTDSDGEKCVWCAPCRLLYHMVRLYQIGHRYPDSVPSVVLIGEEVTA